ncbi:MAG TPA: NADH-quinone oxidoreductase subunit NuoF [Gemmatimonadales bacterium]|jgi:NADH-quinone oxidoreductase subunit F|nr:NADH-quinone oxidoreductase subunit NuoF [Gemmatimonadales bacterium]
MGFPHPSHPRETVVLSKYFGDSAARTHDGWVQKGGYQGLKKALGMTPEAVIEEVKASGLRGRGGAGFPTGLKWSFMPKNDGKPHFLVCNADESEPGTFKDREIMRWTPHGLIEGCAIGCHAIAAERCYVYIRGEFTEPWKVMNKAVEEAYAKGVLGPNAMGSGKRIDIVLHRGAGAYICGEETAMLNSLEGKRGNPRIKPPFPAQAGAFGLPTTVNNVETLAAVPHIMVRGAEWYKGLCLSNPKSTGTKLISVCGHIQRPGNYEITMGFPMKDLIYDMAGGMRPGRKLKAVIPGGSSVPIMNAAETEDCLMDYEGIVARGSMLGSAGFIVMDDSTDMVYQVYRLARFYAHESCAQCTQCREGTAWTVKILERMLAGKGKQEDLQLLLDLSEQMTGKTICVLSDSCAAPVVSGIQKFPEEFEAYVKGSKTAVMASV